MPENRERPEKERESGEKLENQIFYHGLREKDEIAAELTRVGDFIVRASMVGGFPQIILNVLDRRGPCNMLIDVTDDGKYMLHIAKSEPDAPAFKNVVQLVEHYRCNLLPRTTTKLRRPVERPKWCIRAGAISYTEANKLGEGNFCAVYAGSLNLKGTLRQVAIKVCHQKAEMTADEVQEACLSMLYEAKIMSLYTHDNVVEFFGVSCDHPPIRIVLEFCAGGSLDSHLKKHSEITDPELVLYAFEAALGMRYLHSAGCIHRDLAARNCLISSAGIIKIGDFGLSKIADKEYKEEKALKHIPLRWMAPETLRRPPMYLTNSDVWSFGALLFELFNKGQAPFHDEDDFKKIAKRIRAGDMPKAPKSLPPVIEKMLYEDIWVVEAEKRFFFQEIVQLLHAVLESLTAAMPPMNEMAVNKIKGVNRTVIFSKTRNEYLHPECNKPKPTKDDSSRRSSMKRRKHKSSNTRLRSVARRRTRSKSVVPGHSQRSRDSVNSTSKDSVLTSKKHSDKENGSDEEKE